MRVVAKVALQPVGRTLVAASLSLAFLMVGNASGARPVSFASSAGPVRAVNSTCQLNSAGNQIHHVIYIQFDNVHFTRDNPNVPSDLQQMPHLLNFIKQHGTLLTNHHTPLIAHTADDILTSLTGVYGDRHGQPISNSYDYYDQTGTPHYTSSFKYWTDPVATSGDTTYNMINELGQNTPAPWVTYTRAGCNVGAFGTANIELENVGSDVNTVFGPNSPEAQEAKANYAKAVADYEGIAIHCAATSTLCSSASGGFPDSLPQEPGGYNGYNALYGAKFVNPVLTNGGTTVNDLFGNPIQDSHGNPGFPGFDPTAAQSLAYVAAMQENGVPITYSYIADAHDNQAGGTFGPGEAGYVAQLKSYDRAFGDFFTNLSQHGINRSNSLFVITADEGDHFVGGPPSPANCDGVTTPCTYKNKGEFDANMPGLLSSQYPGINTKFDIHFDSAPNFYLDGQPSQTSGVITRPFERAVGSLTAPNPITGKTVKATRFLADQAEMGFLHMITSDPNRDATFTDFGDPNYYFETYDQCTGQLVCEGSGYAWNHGDVGGRINTTFLGLVGPGIAHLGIDHHVWTDHTDIRPTMMSLLGLHDDYLSDGRVITEVLTKKGLNGTERKDKAMLHTLGFLFKEINAPVGQLSMDTLRASTKAMKSGSAGNDSEYLRFDTEITHLTNARNDLVAEVQKALDNAEYNGVPMTTVQFKRMVTRAKGLLAWGADIAGSYT